MLELALALAIVTQDQIPLRGAPHENAPRHATLAHGDQLEVRGVRGEYLQVYDYRRERAGYIRATQASRYALTPEEAPRLKAVVDFLTEQPGYEALGIGHTAAFIAAAPAEQIDAQTFVALGTMADRLAARASRLSGATSGTNAERARIVTGHLEVAAHYGVRTRSVEKNEKITLCYDGEAWRRVLALPATPEQKARAALALTRHECVDPLLSPGERLQTDLWRAELLDQALASGNGKETLPAHLKDRLEIRAAGIWAGIAHQRARQTKPDPAAILAAGQNAETHLLRVDKKALVDGDLAAWNEAAIRVGASRWAAVPLDAPAPVKGRPSIRLVAGEPGQTCIQIIEGQADAKAPAAATSTATASTAFTPQCTYGQVWPASLTVSPDGKFMTLAVQPLETWRELWLFHKEGATWQVEAIPPATENPELGYIEFAGWVPGNKQFLAARETVVEGRGKTSFELWSRVTLSAEKRADKPGNLTPFYRWQDPAWKGGTIAIR
ncbi:MAG: hypothetical protein LBO00_10435 [Zoogloeaceae bacterium]|jgi:hypothetical protein|nr:hypothetical protein [Zoogloeaceae bacterium]